MDALMILGIDSAAKSVSAAVCDGTRVLAQTQLNIELTHSQTLLPIVESLLNNSKISINDIDRFAVSSGPGSFTGLRISVAAVKGLAYALSKECVGVSSLEAAASNAVGFDGLVCAVMDARCSQVYTALFRTSRGENSLARITEDCAISISELELLLKNYSEPILFVGDGAEMCYNIMSKNLPNLFLAPPHLLFPSGFGVCLCAQSPEYSPVSADELALRYLRLPQAERERLKKLAENSADK